MIFISSELNKCLTALAVYGNSLGGSETIQTHSIEPYTQAHEANN